MYVDEDRAPRGVDTQARQKLKRPAFVFCLPHAQLWDAEVGRTIHVFDVSKAPIIDFVSPQAGSQLIALTTAGALQYVSCGTPSCSLVRVRRLTDLAAPANRSRARSAAPQVL